MHQFFVDELPMGADAGAVVGAVVALPPEEARHAAGVVRVRVGEQVALSDGENRALAEVTGASRDAVTARVLSPLPSAEARVRVTLYQGYPKGDKLDGIVQKATEAGAARVVPVVTARSVARPEGGGDGRNGARDGKAARNAPPPSAPDPRTLRLRRIAREAAKQCGRARVLEVAAPLSSAQAADRMASHALLLVPWEDERAVRLPEALSAGGEMPCDIGVVVGPEGGLSREEVDALCALGARTVTLGPRILRTETAGLCALAAILTLSGDM